MTIDARPDRFDKAMHAGADGVAIDLEDAVDPRGKVDARNALGEWLAARAAAAPHAATLCFVRINAPGSPWFDADLAWLTGMAGVDGVLVPKVEDAAALERVAAALPRPLIPLLESARALLASPAIAAARAPMAAICLGAEDLTADIGIPRTAGGDEILVARSIVVLAATAAGARAIDAVFTDVAAGDRLEADARRARALGFHGKLAVHPAQIPIINAVFSPTSADIDDARRVVEADADARARGEGVTRLGNQMIDAPVVRRAERILAWARAVRDR
jgi:citrate lyase subunit beta/citryl-CoA lyase